MEIPANTTAQICLDEAKMVKESDGLEFDPADNCMKAEAGSGKYRIVFERKEM